MNTFPQGPVHDGGKNKHNPSTKKEYDILSELNKIDEEEEKTYNLENSGDKKIVHGDDLGRQKGCLNMQNTLQVQIAPRKSQGQRQEEIQMDQPQILTQLQNLNQSEDEDHKENEDQFQSQQQSNSEDQLQLSLSKPQPQQIQKARCPKLSDEPSQVWPLNLNNVYEMRAFLMAPCPPGVKIQCTIQRIRNSYYNRYECYLVIS